MDMDTVGTVLWIVAGFLMVAGVAGVGLALLFDKPAAEPTAARPARRLEAQAVAVVERVPAKPLDEKVVAARRAAYRQGIIVLLALAVLTAVEFWIGFSVGSTVFLFILILAKAGLIVQYYMHLNRLWGAEEAL